MAEYTDPREEMEALREEVRELRRELARYQRDGQFEKRGSIEVGVAERETLLSEVERIARFGTWVWHISSDEVYWSDELYRILGYDPAVDEASGEAYFARIHPDDVERVRDGSARGVKSGVAERVHFRLVMPSGEIRHALTDGAFVFDPDGTMRRSVGIVIDITESRETARARRRGESFMRSAEGMAALGYMEVSVRTDERWWSPGIRRILGVGDEVVPSVHAFLERVHVDDREALLAARAEAVASGKEINVDFRIQPLSGDLRYCRGIGSRGLSSDGEQESLNIFVIDVTEQHRLRSRLLAAERLEGIGRLAGGVAHDINNLMMLVTAAASAIADSFPGESVALDDVVAKASSLTRNLLSVSGRAHLEAVPLDINGLVRETLARTGIAAAPGVSVRLDLDEGMPSLLADPAKLEQAIMNVVVNARDALETSGGTINVRTRRHDGSQVMIEVEDDGPGMPEHVRQRAVEPFFTTKPAARGTGLGLALVRATLEKHGGVLELESAPGRGTRAKLVFPLRAQEPGSKRAQRASSACGSARALKILVVDDNDLVRGAVCRQLRGMGHQVHEAGLPSEAIELTSNESFEMLLCDLVMPELLGPALVDNLRSRRRCPPLVLYMTGYGDAAERMISANDLVLRKPFTLAQLREAVGALVGECEDA